MGAEEVGVKDDRGSVRMLKGLLGLEGLAQGFGGNDAIPEIAEQIIDIGLQDPAAVLLLQADLRLFIALEPCMLMLADGGAVEVGVAADPGGQMAEVMGSHGAHILSLFGLEGRNPLVIAREDIEGRGADLLVLVVFGCPFRMLDRILLDHDVVIHPVVAVEDGHETGDLRAVADMVGRKAGLPLAVDDAVHAGVDQGEGAQHQIVHRGDALAGNRDVHLRQHDVVVDQGRAVAHLDEHVRREHGALTRLNAFRAHVVMEQIPGHPGALGLPVQPDAFDAVMDVIPADGHVDGGVQLDARGFRAAQLGGGADMMDMAVLNGGEDRAHAADDAGLLAVVHLAAADDVVADLFLQPAVILPAAHRVALHLGRALDMLRIEIHVILRIPVFSQRDAAAFAVADFAVLDDPALRPVGADEAVLIGGGRRPGRGRLVQHEAGHRDAVDTVLAGHEDVPADGNLGIFLVGIQAVEIGVQDSLVPVLLGIPGPGRGFLIPGMGIRLRVQAVLQARGLEHHQVVDEDRAGMADDGGKIPVAANHLDIGIPGPEEGVLHPGCPGIALVGRPGLQLLGAGDPGRPGLLAAVGDTGFLCARMHRADVFAVDAGSDDDFVAGEGDFGRVVDVAEGTGLTAVAVAEGIRVDIIDHGFLPFIIVVFDLETFRSKPAQDTTSASRLQPSFGPSLTEKKGFCLC